MKPLQSLRGMVDLLPGQTPFWQRIEATARDHFRRAAVEEIRTPLLEVTELFARGIGEATDVVGKEMYSFEDRGERHCTLRPEGTASVVRAAIQHGLVAQGPQRLWYGGPMFRYERPQAGRQRQFHQIGLEFLGHADPRSDVEAIAIAWDLLMDLGVGGLSLELNSLGSSDDRLRYRSDLVTWLEAHREDLDPDSQQRISTNPLRVLDSKNAQTQALLAGAPTLADALSDESRERFLRVRQGLEALAIPFRLNPRLVRGLDYYGHTAFEITSSQLGAQATVCGGGRYDGLVEQLGGPPTPAVGWALGMERLVLLLSQALQDESAEQRPTAAPDLYVVSRGVEGEAYAMRLARQCRHRPGEPLAVQVDLSGAGFDKQLKRARRSGARWALLLGDEEAANGTVRLMLLVAGGGGRRAEGGEIQMDRLLSETDFLALSIDQLDA
ncbi:histidine--tRNA ligase [Synechococcus sp. CS-1332]|uniref:histidine--tRNA ligase n=1 Tax=Synechococcus sp. CS-1332 TaxID=2847972 RepID=UPI00223C1386|nr:histidine--tRNA ligase [Synechococcus sp. CS-1332]MCT0208474.1 histidine--tRNA ligase [Synechococcus sp. CS-1332]